MIIIACYIIIDGLFSNVLFMVMFYFDIILMVFNIIFYLFIHDNEWVGHSFGFMDLIIIFYL